MWSAWSCRCGATSIRREQHTAIISGKGYLRGQPYTHVACATCQDSKRIGLEPIWEDIDRTPFGSVKRTKKRKANKVEDDPNEKVTFVFKE